MVRAKFFFFQRERVIAKQKINSPTVVRRVMRELKDLEKNPPEGIRVRSSEEDILDLTGIIEGPGGSLLVFFVFVCGSKT